VWSVDLPHTAEREAIWEIHIIKTKRNPKKFNISELAKLTDGYSGRQIDAVWEKAMTAAFNDGQREPEQSDITDALKKFVPTSVTMADAIEKRRKRLSGCATPASRPEAPAPLTKANGRKLAAAA
jgi:SpoVK/Ycf46/Vps4 family AAA+-type ATPase